MTQAAPTVSSSATVHQLPTAVHPAPSAIDAAIDSVQAAVGHLQRVLDAAPLSNLVLAVRHEHDRAHWGEFDACPSMVCQLASQMQQ